MIDSFVLPFTDFSNNKQPFGYKLRLRPSLCFLERQNEKLVINFFQPEFMESEEYFDFTLSVFPTAELAKTHSLMLPVYGYKDFRSAVPTYSDEHYAHLRRQNQNIGRDYTIYTFDHPVIAGFVYLR